MIMKHCGTRRLETDRLILRRFVNTDAEAMYHNGASDPEVTKYLMWPTHTSVEVSQKVTDEWVSSYAKEHCVVLTGTIREFVMRATIHYLRRKENKGK